MNHNYFNILITSWHDFLQAWTPQDASFLQGFPQTGIGSVQISLKLPPAKVRRLFLPQGQVSTSSGFNSQDPHGLFLNQIVLKI